MARILLVDDDVDLVAQNRLVLEKKGHDVVVAYNAAEARDLLDGAAPDLMVLDVMMEETTTGFQLARDVRARYPSLPLLMLTGIREAKNVRFKIEPDECWLPVTVFMEKPVTPEKLAAEIAALLAGK
jgi:DNA-binding response OmpR family regulator